MKPGSKYYPLFQYLNDSTEDAIRLTFAEIEAIMNASLPASAGDRQNWWSNRDSPSALQASAWISAGYHVETVDLHEQTVQFQKFQADYNIQRKDGDIIWQRDAIKALRKHMNMTQAQFAKELGVRRQTVSEWENGVYDPDRKTSKFLELIAKQTQFSEPSDSS
ncbi:MAG: helix-turn-helix transcriptional regulator [Leptolyngbyaceae bacterium]|nr:helix-turn-helix transcriptional regulator [Leptolyngbyaceae bacterium]